MDTFGFPKNEKAVATGVLCGNRHLIFIFGHVDGVGANAMEGSWKIDIFQTFRFSLGTMGGAGHALGHAPNLASRIFRCG
jgi:hypothetical protein